MKYSLAAGIIVILSASVATVIAVLQGEYWPAGIFVTLNIFESIVLGVREDGS